VLEKLKIDQSVEYNNFTTTKTWWFILESPCTYILTVQISTYIVDSLAAATTSGRHVVSLILDVVSRYGVVTAILL